MPSVVHRCHREIRQIPEVDTTPPRADMRRLPHEGAEAVIRREVEEAVTEAHRPLGDGEEHLPLLHRDMALMAEEWDRGVARP
jgi:hypothetical protein